MSKNGVCEFSTYRKYCYVCKYLEEFLYYRYKLKDIALIDICSCFIIDFELYLRKKRRCSNNTVCIYIAPLKRMISIAQSNGWLDYNPFSSYYIPAQ
ncbi:phage integrase SAM-like domain-containing protein [Bacteroides fragilis]